MSPDYCGNHNGPAEVENFGSYIITYCIFWMFISLLILPICAYFKDQINRFWTTLQLSGHFHCVWNYFVQVFRLFIGLYYIIKECRQLNVPDKETPQHLEVEQELPKTSPPLEEFITLIIEQLILHPSIEDSSLLQEILFEEYCELQTLHAELPILYPLDIQFARSCTPQVVIHDRALAEFIAGKDQCLKFINQDLTFLQPSVISSASRNTVQNDNSPAQTNQLDSQVTSLAAVNLPTHVTKPRNSTPPTQTVEPVLGFTPAEIRRAEKEPKLTVEQLLGLSSCKGYVQMPLQTLDGMYVNQPS